LHRFALVHHRECERQPLVVVSYNLATRQRHRNPYPFESRMRRPIVSVEYLGPNRSGPGWRDLDVHRDVCTSRILREDDLDCGVAVVRRRIAIDSRGAFLLYGPRERGN
jgi:hypothetical protein